MLRALRWLYRRLGRLYPRLAVAVLLAFAHIVAGAGIALLRLYQEMSAGEFWLLMGVAQVLVLIDNAASLRTASRLLSPVSTWLRGNRSDAATLKAWSCLVALPPTFFRQRLVTPLALTSPAICSVIVLVLELPLLSFLPLMLGGFVVITYGVLARYFGFELVLRPVLEDVASQLPSDDGPLAGPRTMSLRMRLLLGLPLINVITGVVASGLSTDGQAELADLGVDVIVAVAVAFTLSLELTALLSRSILVPLADLRRATERVAAGQLDVRVPVTSTDETGELARSFNRMVAGLQERERLREALGSYVDPGVAERILAEGVDLAGDEVEVTVCFIDIQGFTAFAEESSAAEVVARLNEFYERVVPVLLRHRGHANKFIGDGLLAVFGAPDRLPDHADRAVAAAREIADLVDSSYGSGLRVGIGVNSGPVVAGTIGGGGRLDFTVIGDTVNTASRVEAATRETGDVLLLTEATRCLLEREHGPLSPRGSVPLRGKREEVRLWALEGAEAPAEGAEPDQAAVPGPQA